MAGPSDGKSFRSFLIVWAAGATLTSLGLAVVVIYLLLRPDREPSSSRSPSTATRAGSPAAMPPAPSENSEKSATAFSALPRGTRVLDGVAFRIGRPVNIIGARAAKAGGKEFARISNQPVNGRGKHIHVLHTGDHGASPQKVFIWRLVLHYADGDSARFDFAYGVHLRNYWWRPNEGDDDLADPNSSIAWTGTSLESDRKGARLRVSRTTLHNPKPRTDIVSADYVSLLGHSSAYVLAVAVTDDGPAPNSRDSTQIEIAPQVALLPFQIQTAAGTSDSTAALDCILQCDGFAVRFVQAPADLKGNVIVDIPSNLVRQIGYTARDAAGRTRSGSLEMDDQALTPQVIRFLAE